MTAARVCLGAGAGFAFKCVQPSREMIKPSEIREVVLARQLRVRISCLPRSTTD
jgi:hypothetical protein